MSSKDQILACLKASRGNWVSGESLSGKIMVSRSAIWKQICKLRAEGYVIESSPNKGYHLQEIPQLLLPCEIQEDLETGFIGKRKIFYYRETDSTNARAKELAANGMTEGALIISEEQKQGRGRRGREWFSPYQEGIYASVILRPKLSPAEAPKLTLLAAVATAEALMALTTLEVSIKWPNDIFVGNKKIAGILMEIATEMDVIDYVIAGLGLNVHTLKFPAHLQEKVTSIFLETGEQVSRVRLLREFLKQLETYYELSKRSGFGPVFKRWRELTHVIHRRAMVDLIDTQCIGTIQDIDSDGALILKDDDGNLRRIFSGDLTLLESIGGRHG